MTIIYSMSNTGGVILRVIHISSIFLYIYVLFHISCIADLDLHDGAQNRKLSKSYHTNKC